MEAFLDNLNEITADGKLMSLFSVFLKISVSFEYMDISSYFVKQSSRSSRLPDIS